MLAGIIVGCATAVGIAAEGDKKNEDGKWVDKNGTITYNVDPDANFLTVASAYTTTGELKKPKPKPKKPRKRPPRPHDDR